MTATSGPGISLYSENIGFAQMAELPLVIVDVQRMGPATGGATTNAEGDVQFVRWVTSGGYPLIVLCPSSLAESYSLTIEAFNLAERFRTPVFLLTCKEMVMNRESVNREDYRKPALAERKWGTGGEEGDRPYHYQTLSDIPPFLPIGGPIPSRVNASIHDEKGLLEQDPVRRERALQHLSEKIESRRTELEYVREEMETGAETLLIAYGLAARSARDAVKEVRRRGRALSLLILHSLWPVPEGAIKRAAQSHKRIVIPEHNMGQYAYELRRILPNREICSVTRIDGEMISPQELIDHVY
jgi:2-oxoglutarate ferredoxin oxidoreductase subunit alpha